MPAAAASLSSSSRRKKMKEAQSGRQRSGRGRGMSRDSSYRSSRNNLMAERGSQRNLMRPHHGDSAQSHYWAGHGLAASMPTLLERPDSSLEAIRTGLDDSMKSNPELFLKQREQLVVGESSYREELQRRRNPQNLEPGEPENRGGEQNNVHLEEPHQALDHPPSKRLPPLKDKDSLPENNATNPRDKKKNLPWYLEPFNVARKFIGQIVNLPWVQNTVLLLIMVNAVMMGIATFPSVKNNPEVLSKFELCDQIFLILFTIESAMQLIYHGWNLFKDGFLVFDLLIVVLSWALVGAQVFRAFRIFRAMRLITRIDTLKNLVQALFSVVPKMTAIFMLLMLIFYIFAVMFTQLFKGMLEQELVEEPYFETIYFSLFTLFQMMTLDEWAEILIQIQVTYSWAWMPFVLFIIITGFVVVNLIIAVICDAVHVLGQDDKECIQGYESDVSPLLESDEGPYQDDYPPPNAAEQRIGHLQMQLDEMVLVQDQMKETIELLIQRLQENAARERALLSEQKDSREKYLSVIESRTNSWGEAVTNPPDRQILLARSWSTPDDSSKKKS